MGHTVIPLEHNRTQITDLFVNKNMCRMCICVDNYRVDYGKSTIRKKYAEAQINELKTKLKK
jgi:hypothetical protein